MTAFLDVTISGIHYKWLPPGATWRLGPFRDFSGFSSRDVLVLAVGYNGNEILGVYERTVNVDGQRYREESVVIGDYDLRQ